MKIVSWNIKGLCKDEKRLKIKNFVQNHCPDMVCLQETKIQRFDPSMIKSLWSSKDIGWSTIDAIGKSGGILMMWDEVCICVKEVIKGGHTLSILILAYFSLWSDRLQGKEVFSPGTP